MAIPVVRTLQPAVQGTPPKRSSVPQSLLFRPATAVAGGGDPATRCRPPSYGSSGVDGFLSPVAALQRVLPGRRTWATHRA